jgi:secondary thiamine-phosphate synthase enzyme
VKTLSLSTRRRVQLVEITEAVREYAASERLRDGIVVVHSPHTTAGITINENADPSVVRDLAAHLEKLVPEHAGFTHAEGNSDAHVKSTLVGPSLTLIVADGQLVLGTWQGVYFCEFDGPRTRQVHLQAIASR